MDYTIRSMNIADYEQAVALWQATEGMGLSAADERPSIARYLERNLGMSAVALDENGRMVGAVLCGHDGRRGYLHHLAVLQECRGQGLGSALVDMALEELRAVNIDKVHVFAYTNNTTGRSFWEREGWSERKTLVILSKDIEG